MSGHFYEETRDIFDNDEDMSQYSTNLCSSDIDEFINSVEVSRYKKLKGKLSKLLKKVSYNSNSIDIQAI